VGARTAKSGEGDERGASDRSGSRWTDHEIGSGKSVLKRAWRNGVPER
jgi:hypothetical protein